MRFSSVFLLAAVAASACSFDAQVDLGESALPGPGPASGPDGGAEPPPSSSCGNGSIEAPLGEECDDGNAHSGDGCSSACALEPAFRCPDEGESCERILDVEITEPFEPILATVMISEEVDAVACTEGVLVGFEVRGQEVLGGMIGLRGICGTTQVGPDGVVRWTSSGQTSLLGSNGPSAGITSCNDDELMVGVEFDTSALFVTAVAPICARWTVEDGQLGSASATTRISLGEPGFPQPKSCGDGRAVGKGMGGSPGAGGFFSLGVICGDVAVVTE